MLLIERTYWGRGIKLLAKLKCRVTTGGAGVKVVFFASKLATQGMLGSGWWKFSITSRDIDG